MFPLVRAAVSRLIPPERLRWIAFGHYEADECGAMNEWLAVAPQAAGGARTDRMHGVAQRHGRPRAARPAGRRDDRPRERQAVRYLDTPHIPHGWDAGVLYEETTGTLLCGDLFTQLGEAPALTERDIVGPAIAAEDLFRFSSLNPGMGPTIRKLAALAPRTIALMHGPSFAGDGAAALRGLADDYDRRVRAALTDADIAAFAAAA